MVLEVTSFPVAPVAATENATFGVRAVQNGMTAPFSGALQVTPFVDAGCTTPDTSGAFALVQMPVLVNGNGTVALRYTRTTAAVHLRVEATGATGLCTPALEVTSGPPVALRVLRAPHVVPRARVSPVAIQVVHVDALDNAVETISFGMDWNMTNGANCTGGALQVTAPDVTLASGVATLRGLMVDEPEAQFHLQVNSTLGHSACLPLNVVDAFFTNDAPALGVTALHEPLTGFAAVAASDVDGDGYVDLAVRTAPAAAGDGDVTVLFNSGPGSVTWGTFVPVELNTQTYRAVVLGDCNEDGRRDVLLTGQTVTTSPNVAVLRTETGRTFTTMGDLAMGLANPNPEGAAWLDYDLDGHLDVLHPTGEGAMRLARGDGTCAFVDVTASVGLPSMVRNGEYVLAEDVDDDGDPDLLYASGQPSLLGPPGELRSFENLGSQGFVDVTQQVGLAGWVPGYRMGMAFGDVDNDGDADLFMGSAAPTPDDPFQPRLFLFDAAQAVFVDATASSGDLTLPRVAVPIHAATMVDVNSDGRLDVWAVPASGPELLFVSNANGTFTECGVDLGLDPSPGDNGHAGLALFDYNNDGRLDVVVHPASAAPPRIYTAHAQDNRTLGVMLTSSLGPNVRDPAGRRVRVRDANGTLLGSRQVSTGGGPGQDDSVVRFGLGARASSMVTVEVRTFAGAWTSVDVQASSVTAVRNGVMLPRTVEVTY